MAEAPDPLWQATAAEPPGDGALAGDADVDVAIVGGGYTGLSTALHAAEAGLSVQLLEAGRIGAGGSGRNAGLVNAGLWLPPQEVRRAMGEARGGRLVAALGAGPDLVFDLVERHQIRCEAVRQGTIHAAHGPAGQRDLAARAAEWRRLGAPVTLLSAGETAERTGTRAFAGGLLDARAGTINPMGYARGLARAAAAAGARIATETPVTGLAREGEHWRLTTPAGTVTAPRAVIATGAYAGALWPGLRESFVPISYFQLATEPLGDRAAGILPGGQGLWDTGRIMFSLRKDAFGRLIVGSMGTVIGGRTGLSRAFAARRLARLFPGLGRVAFETAWDGRIALTAEHLPRIHRLAPGLYAPAAYNGRGIAPGTVFGRALAALLAGGAEAELPLPVTPLRPESARGLRAGLFQTAFTLNQLVRSI